MRDARAEMNGRTIRIRPPATPYLVTLLLLLTLSRAVTTDAEWWPVSSMRLFSMVRGPTATSWRVTLLSGATEQPLDFARLDRGFRGAHDLIPRMISMEPGDRDAICSRWAAAAVRRGHVRATEVRVEKVLEVFSQTGEVASVRVEPAFVCRVHR